MHIETHILKGTTVTFQKKGNSFIRKMKSYKEPVVNIKDEDGIKFLHLTDLHMGMLYIPTYKIIDTIKAHKPDILVLTGDYFSKVTEIDLFLEFMQDIRAIFKNEIYLCFGNHDNVIFNNYPGTLEKVTTFLKNINVIILENSASVYAKETSSNKMKLNIIGLSDARSNKENIKPLVDKLRRTQIPNLLITHNCDILLKMNEGSVDYAIVGHTHGAQVRTPFNIEIKLLHRRDKLSQQNIIRSLHRYKDIDLYISRGLGNTLLPIRFISKPEIVIGHIPYN